MRSIDDHASELEQFDRDLALSRRKPEGPKAMGACLYCLEPLDTERRWCDADCRDHWECEEQESAQRERMRRASMVA
ncbi:hypothetical protein J2T57_001651 [Natronocella acetinitrilica]|uniref:DUF2116 family Zn-ribbon domain-containing protein n=1 Tax=Natronocella acetinitrilica TaxID=414046 RepID=A0AAE3G3S4_9GAMM|nr:hypothetical protein [Natronocella acetinitrilica]MCP1674549.1 hypothetical protein [Natronocella acetinitrilica]